MTRLQVLYRQLSIQVIYIRELYLARRRRMHGFILERRNLPSPDAMITNPFSSDFCCQQIICFFAHARTDTMEPAFTAALTQNSLVVIINLFSTYPTRINWHSTSIRCLAWPLIVHSKRHYNLARVTMTNYTRTASCPALSVSGKWPDLRTPLMPSCLSD
jgi:hypothetical protein